MAARPFWTAFLDGLTMGGLSGDLRIPGDQSRLFAQRKSQLEVVFEPSDEKSEAVIAIPEAVMTIAEFQDLQQRVQDVVRQQRPGKVIIPVPTPPSERRANSGS